MNYFLQLHYVYDYFRVENPWITRKLTHNLIFSFNDAIYYSELVEMCSKCNYLFSLKNIIIVN